MSKPDPERWALASNGRASSPRGHEIVEAGGEGGKLVRVEKSFTARNTHAAFIGVEIPDSYKTTNMHLTADDAEGIATVLLFLADKWRKENT